MSTDVILLDMPAEQSWTARSREGWPRGFDTPSFRAQAAREIARQEAVFERAAAFPREDWRPAPEHLGQETTKSEPTSIMGEVAPFLLAVIGIPAFLLLITPRRPGESRILRRPQSARYR